METKNADLSSLKIDRDTKLKNPEQRGKMIKMIATVTGIIILLFVIYFAWRSFTNPSIEVKLTSVTLQSPAQTNAVLT
ncbi:MAG: hypothetical protein ACYC6D_04250, partial [Melioribacteraceae bacterium]